MKGKQYRNPVKGGHLHHFEPHRTWPSHFVCVDCGFVLPEKLLDAAYRAGATYTYARKEGQ